MRSSDTLQSHGRLSGSAPWPVVRRPLRTMVCSGRFIAHSSAQAFARTGVPGASCRDAGAGLPPRTARQAGCAAGPGFSRRPRSISRRSTRVTQAREWLRFLRQCPGSSPAGAPKERNSPPIAAGTAIFKRLALRKAVAIGAIGAIGAIRTATTIGTRAARATGASRVEKRLG